MARKYRRDARGRFAGGGSRAPRKAMSSAARTSAPRGTIGQSATSRSINRTGRSLGAFKKPLELMGTRSASPTGQGRRLPARRSNAPSAIVTDWAKTTAPRGTISKRADSRVMNRDFRGETTAKERRAPDTTTAKWNSTAGSQGRRLPRRRR